MDPIVNELLNQIKFKKDQVGNNAVTDLSFVLEMHAWNLSRDAKISRYNSLVRQELIDLDLDHNSIIEILDFLKNEIQNKSYLTAGLLFSMGQTSCDVGIVPLLSVIESSLMDFSENDFYQALVSLEKLVFFDESLSLEEVKKIIKQYQITKKISRKILSFQSISRVDLESTCLRLLARLVLLFEEHNN